MIVNVLGYGLMGKQIAALMYLAGYQVHIWNHKNVNENDIQRNIKILKRNIESNEGGHIEFHSNVDTMPDAITIESVLEDLDVKKELYESFKSRGVHYFTNSSSFSPSEINKNVNGFHFFNPISLKVIEMYLTDSEIKKDLEELIRFLTGSGFELIEVNDNRGYIGNYILFNEVSSALKLIEKYNYTYEQVSAIYSKLYDGRDLFLIIDLIGLDVVFQILKNLREEDKSIYLPECLSLAISRGVLGKKNKTSIKDVLQ